VKLVHLWMVLAAIGIGLAIGIPWRRRTEQ
jgi:hypothetical protein